MYRFLQVFFSLFSAALLALAIPNELVEFGSPALGLVALAPLYAALRRARSVRGAFAVCLVHGLSAHVMSSFWLGNFKGYAAFTLGASAVGTGVFEALLSLSFHYPSLALAASGRDEAARRFGGGREAAFRAVWFAATYTVWEWCKSTGFLAYPWGTLSMTAYRWNAVTQIADITGPYGVSFLFALCSAIAGEAISGARIRALAPAARLAAALFAAAALYGAWQLAVPREPVKTMRAVLAQQNGDPWDKGEDKSIAVSCALSERKVAEIRAGGGECDLVVWSEAVLTRRFPGAAYFYSVFPESEPLTRFVARLGVPFIIGGPVQVSVEPRRVANSALLFTKEGEWAGAYQKMHLVPFAELVPGNEIPLVRQLMKKAAGFSYGWYPGKCVTLCEIPISGEVRDVRASRTISLDGGISEEPPLSRTVRMGTPICFDDTAAEVCRAMWHAGAEMFMNVTNDAWSLTASAEVQHFVVAHYRAIEYRTTLARSTNAGLTAVVGPTGRTLCSLPLFEEGALDAEIPVYERTATTYAIFGNWLPVLLAMLAAAYTVRARRRLDDGGSVR